MQHNHVESYFFLALLVGVLTLAFFVFLPFLASIVLSAAFAIVLQPVYLKIAEWVNGRDNLTAFLTVIIVILLIIIPLSIFSVRLFDEVASLSARLSSFNSPDAALQGVTTKLNDFAARFNVTLPDIQVSEYGRRGVSWMLENVGSVFSGVLNGLGFFTLSLLGLFYFLRDGAKFKQSLAGLMPLSPEYTKAIFDKLTITVNSVVRGTLTIAVAQGVLAGIGFWIFGVPSAIFWAAIATVTSLVPMVGNAIITVPAIIFLLVTGHPFAALGLAVWSLLIVGLADNALRPILLERSVKIHPFLILLSVLGGLSLFGPIGFVMGPLVLSLLFALLEIYAKTVLKKEDVPETA